MRVLSSTLFAFASAVVALPALAAPWDKPGWELTFHDEFDGSAVDATQWARRYKWGEAQINGELQAYVDDAFQLSSGTLSIVGDERSASYAGQTFQYASGVLCSVHEQTYGYFEARLKVPAGRGLWPAFWLLGNVNAAGVNEIDIHEILGNEPNHVYMTLHWGTDYAAGHKSDGSDWLGPDFSADFHVFGLEWSPDAIVWTIDGVERKRHTGDGIPRVPMYVILNLAIGGGWPGAPDTTTTFPAAYQIDYVRAYSPAPDAGATDGGSAGSSGSGGASGAGSSGAAGSGGASGTVGDGGASTAGTPGTAGDGANAPSSAADKSACGCRVVGRTEPTAGVSLLTLLALAWASARRRRRGHGVFRSPG